MGAKRKIFNKICENFEIEKLKFKCRFTIWKTAENNYYHKRPLRRKLRNVYNMLSKNLSFMFKKMKETESPKITLKVL